MLGTVAAACVAAATITVPVPSGVSSAAPLRPQVDPAPINGAGSSYVAGAMGKWTADAYTSGLRVNYAVQNSPLGLTRFQSGNTDFAGTEAEFTSLLGLGNDNRVTRGFQYVPDVAGAVGIMYNIRDRAGNQVDYLRLSRQTVARIFLGDITNWSDRAITNDLGGQIVLPDQPIKVVYRSGESGTTALFYDFVQNMAPDLFNQWVERNRYPRDVRIINLGTSPNFVPNSPIAADTSDLMAVTVRETPGAITYDEFFYAIKHGVNTAWIQNESGNWVQPYALNISQALESAQLRPDLSQELSQVYRSRAPDAYPISAYSYLVTQCAPSGDRPTCKGNYGNQGVAETLGRWMAYIACDGQVDMDITGYAPLPPNLSQEMMYSIQRMWGRPLSGAPRLTQANCNNPRFDPNYRPPAPPAPPPLPPPPGENGPNANTDTTDVGNNANRADAAGADSTAADEAAAGREGSARAVGGGSGDWRDSDPTAYHRPGLGPIGMAALVVLLVLLAAPLIAGTVWRKIKHT